VACRAIDLHVGFAYVVALITYQMLK
jgi:hypothetical protein